MSIWCSRDHIGTDPTDWHDEHGPLPKVAERGNVLSYAAGFSNHWLNAPKVQPTEGDV